MRRASTECCCWTSRLGWLGVCSYSPRSIEEKRRENDLPTWDGMIGIILARDDQGMMISVISVAALLARLDTPSCATSRPAGHERMYTVDRVVRPRECIG